MSNLGQITISLPDLGRIITRLEEVRCNTGVIKIVDTGNQFVIRDSGDHLVSHVEKQAQTIDPQYEGGN